MGDLINISLMVSSLAGFLILMWVLNTFAFKPVLNIIDERRESIEAAFQEVDDARAEVARLKAEYEGNMARISAEAQAKLQEAVAQGQALAAQLKAEAESQREKLLARTQEDIQREKDKALAELRNEAIDLSFAMASKVLKGGLDRSLHDKLVSDFVKDLRELNEVQGAVAKRYALALFEAGRAQGKIELLDGQAKQLAAVFSDPLVRQFAGHPRIPAASKKQVLAGKLTGQFDGLLLNLVRLLVDKNRLTALSEILAWFDRLTDQSNGVEGLTIVSAVELTEAQRNQIVELAKRFSAYGELRVKSEVDPALLGGVEVRLGDNLVLDGSVASRMAQLRDKLYKYRHRGLGA